MAYNGAPPPSYEDVMGQCSQTISTDLNIVDFLPGLVSDDDEQYDCETFSGLVRKANNWLQRNRMFTVINCETIDVKNSGADACRKTVLKKKTDSEGSTLHMRMLRCLRVFVRMKTHADPMQPDRIGYFNFPPNSQGSCTDTFENFSVTIGRLNDRLRRTPIDGRILNVETLRVKCRDGCITDYKMERSAWTDYTTEKLRFVMFIRLFYLYGNSRAETIAVRDFLPNQINSSVILSKSQFDSFHALMTRVRLWLSCQKLARVLNVQSINIKVKSSDETVISERMCYTNISTSTTFVRIIRIYHILAEEQAHYKPVMINYRTFVPAEREEIQELMEREVQPWVKYNKNARVLSSETILYRAKTTGVDPNDTITQNKGKTTLYVHCLRVYFDGPVYQPPTNLPLPSQTAPEECCSLL
ncbi:DgyrCDS5302 [Dimorphilus gyrociliatus]|uniref:DgyrCDS5302 n=1 Tax=Dimorphilus gyrociliatus TaxID=2664684 RepID=A0A7I8VLU6_9ANNE|nr:DgyrCDS5302 [Dimorphilus gyrociliatus]